MQQTRGETLKIFVVKNGNFQDGRWIRVMGSGNFLRSFVKFVQKLRFACEFLFEKDLWIGRHCLHLQLFTQQA